MKDTSLLDAALALASHGKIVFPCKNAPGVEGEHKRPLTRNGFKDATRDEAQIRRWWKDHPNALIGMPTGGITGIAVLDLDVKKGKNGLAEVDGWENLSPSIARTGSGGIHVYFRTDGTIRNSTDKIAPGVDTRGEGGYVILPPSHGYEWIKGGDLSQLLPEWPDHLRPTPRQSEPTPNAEPQADIDRVRAALRVTPNDDLGWEDWNNRGMAIFRATGGSAEGRLEFHNWSRKSKKKYDAHKTDDRWNGYVRSPPDKIGAGTLFHLAREAEEASFTAVINEVLARDTPWEDHSPSITGPENAAKDSRAGDTGPNPASDASGPKGSTSGSERNGSTSHAEKKSTAIRAKPFIWIEPKNIPRRQWLYKPSYIRGYASLTGGATGVAKTSLTIVEALAMASGKALLGILPEGKLSVWLHNGEDPADELQRRIVAAMKSHNITKDDIGERLYVSSGRETEIVIVSGGENNRTPTLNVSALGQLAAEIRGREIDVLVIDPLVAAHRVDENNNMAMELVAKSFARIADEANCSVMLVHHAKKTYGEDVRTDDVRGASALAAAVRDVRTLNVMSESDAGKAKISQDDRRLHLRLDRGKSNLMRPASSADWFKLQSVDLGNGLEGERVKGDNVGVVASWTFPQPTYVDMTPGKIRRCLDAIKAGGPWRSDFRAKNEPWVGVPIAAALELNLDAPSDLDAIRKLVADWIGKGLLETVPGRDEARQARTYVTVGRAPATVEDTEPF